MVSESKSDLFQALRANEFIVHTKAIVITFTV